MRKNGFTLIELLAVIVILAIIALIATPIILGIINDAREESQERSAELYLSAVDLAVARRNLTEEFNPSECAIANGVVTCTGYAEPLNVDVDGEIPTSGTIKFENNKVTTGTALTFNGFTARLSEEEKIVIGETEKTPSTPVAKVCTIERQNANKYSVGDVVTCTLSESTDKFYVIEEAEIDATTIQMLTEKNIHTTEYRQSDNAGAVVFSTVEYWVDENYNLLSKYGTSYPTNIYDDNNDTIKPIVDGYIKYLKNKLVMVSGNLLTTTQATELGCNGDSISCGPDFGMGIGTASSWVYSTSYWLSTAYDRSDTSPNPEYSDVGETIMWYISKEGAFYYDLLFWSNDILGVRPVITISTSEIQ